MSPADRARELLDAGRDARDAGQPLTANPHPRGSDEHPAWAHGWRVRDAEIPSIAEQIEELGDYACGYVDDRFQTTWVGDDGR